MMCREQPKVEFLCKFIMVLEGEATSTGLGGTTSEIFVSTMDSLNAMRPESHGMANVEFRGDDDDDRDGVFDSFAMDAVVPLVGDERIGSMQALLFFNTSDWKGG